MHSIGAMHVPLPLQPSGQTMLGIGRIVVGHTCRALEYGRSLAVDGGGTVAYSTSSETARREAPGGRRENPLGVTRRLAAIQKRVKLRRSSGMSDSTAAALDTVKHGLASTEVMPKASMHRWRHAQDMMPAKP